MSAASTDPFTHTQPAIVTPKQWNDREIQLILAVYGPAEGEVPQQMCVVASGPAENSGLEEQTFQAAHEYTTRLVDHGSIAHSDLPVGLLTDHGHDPGSCVDCHTSREHLNANLENALGHLGRRVQLAVSCYSRNHPTDIEHPHDVHDGVTAEQEHAANAATAEKLADDPLAGVPYLVIGHGEPIPADLPDEIIELIEQGRARAAERSAAHG